MASDQSFDHLEVGHAGSGLRGLMEEEGVADSKESVHIRRKSVTNTKPMKKVVEKSVETSKHNTDPELEPLKFSLPKQSQIEHQPPVSEYLSFYSQNQCFDREVYR
jgi:hypothetical protein